MKTVGIAISLIVFFVIGCIASFQGFDLRKRSSWIYDAISFLCGIALGLSLSANLIESLKGGALFAVLTLAGGAAMHRHKQKYNEDMARSLLLKYGKEDDSSLFAKLIRRLLSKYK
jgi:ABC-type Mn2+/Zn2+ transport system permease subunit